MRTITRALLISRIAIALTATGLTAFATANPLVQPTQVGASAQTVQQVDPLQVSAQQSMAAAFATATPSQQACVQNQLHQQEEAARKKRGFSRLLRAVSRTAARSGQLDIVHAVNDVVRTGQTAEDLIGAAADLGVTEDQLRKCLQ